MVEFKTTFKESFDPNFQTTFEEYSTPSFDTRFVYGETLYQGKILSNTCEGWNSQISIISEVNTVYVYTDLHQIIREGEVYNVPGLKVGDGTTYLIDLPFTDEVFYEHIDDSNIHVTAEEKAFWNSKVRPVIEAGSENLVLTTL